MKNTQRIGIYIYDDVELLDMAGPLEVFTTATRVASRQSPDAPPCFEVFTLACQTTKVRTRAGLWVEPDHLIADHPPLDVLLVPGGVVTKELKNVALLRWLAEAAPKTHLVSSVCTGAFLLAEAGLLKGLPVTTHWEDIPDLRRDHPTLNVLEHMRWVDTGHVVTSAGISAGIDMSFHLVARLAGRELALQTARQMEVVWTENPDTNADLSPYSVQTKEVATMTAPTSGHRLLEIRTYRLKPGTLEEFHAAMRDFSAPMLRRKGMDVVAYGRSNHEEESYFLVRSYENRAALESEQSAFYTSAEWREGPRSMLVDKIETYVNTLLLCTEEGVEAMRKLNSPEAA